MSESPRTTPRKRGEGQWALGYHEPLNPAERVKKDDDGLHVRARIETKYSKQGFRSIDKADLRSRFRWWGLYTQRKQGLPGGVTATAEPHELEDEYFMLRIRIPGGQLSSDQLRAVAHCSEYYGRDVADVTDRQNIQLHWIRIEDVPAIWEALEAVGLSTQEACGDTPRVMIGCPLAGVDAGEIIDATPALLETERRYVGDPAFSNLPRKFKTSISGCARHCTNHEINDVAFVGVVGPGGTPGFDLWVGGGLSTNPMFGQRIGVFVEPDDVAEVWAGVTGVFRDYGYRRSRNHARLKFLLADWGVERFREVLEKEYLGRALPDGPEPEASPAHRDHVGIEAQSDGLCSVGATTKAGRTSGNALSEVANLARSVGTRDGRVRLTAQQGLVVLDVPPDRVEETADRLAELGLAVRPSAFHRGTIACTGIEFCKLAIVETKARAEMIRTELERRLPDFETPITINVNGCPNSCARFQVADIGFKGIVTRGADGADQEAFQVHLGGQLGSQATFGRKFRGLKVAAAEAPEYAERVLRGYLERRTEGETFAAYVSRADEAWLL